MKKIYLILLAAAGILAAASCAREEIVDPSQVQKPASEVTTLTVAFDEGIKTALVDGKTYWVKGDVVRIYNSTGAFYNDVVIPEEADGKKTFDCEVDFKDTTYFAVYPKESAAGVADKKVKIKIPSDPDGLFASANICAAETKGTTLAMRNVTAILKVDVTSGNVIEFLQVASKNNMTGTYSVSFEGEAPALTATSGSRSATLAVGGIDGVYYLPIAPGDYLADFAMTALRGNGGYQTLKTTQNNEVKVNTIVDVGTIGGKLSSGLDGEGTEASPYIISNPGEWTAFCASVNLGNHYADKFVSLTYDVSEAVTAPVGYWLAADDQAYFGGTFLGNNHTVKVDLDGDNCKAQTYVALFGVVDAGGAIKDLKVTGKAKASGNYTSGVIGYIRGTEDAKVTVSNCTSEVVVTSGGERVAGIAGYAANAIIENCDNKAAVTAYDNVAGIVGYSYYNTISNCHNTAEIKATTTTNTSLFLSSSNFFALDSISASNSNWEHGVGGITGFTQNTVLSDVSNTAPVSGNIKIGGIAGVIYWSTINNATNDGNVTGSGAMNIRADSQMGQQWGSVTGGIVGYVYTHGNILNCTNNGKVFGHGGIGGIAGNMTNGNNTLSAPTIKNCVNNGVIESSEAYQGGTSACANSGTGGIVGNLVPYGMKINGTWYCYKPYVLNCKNTASVTSTRADGQANFVGGIVGSSYFAGGVLKQGESIIDGCVNEGNVTGGYWVGGIMGGAGARFAGVPTIRNCANHGTVRSDGKSTKYNAILIGGLIGGAIAYNTGNRTAEQFRIYNSYSDGDVVYSQEDYATPYVGGIIGSTWGAVTVQNVYCSGTVGLVSGAAPTDAIKKCLGALVGYQHVADNVKYAYYPATILGGQPMGTNGKAAHASIIGFDDKFDFAGVVTYNSVDYEHLLDILNAWVGTQATYYQWKAGAKGPDFNN